MNPLDLIPKSAMALLIAVLMVTTVKLHWDKNGLIADVQIGKTQIAQLEGAIDKANAESAIQTAALATQSLKAINESKKRESVLLADARSANDALDSLRLSNAVARRSFKLSGPAATSTYIDASLDALDQCSQRYSEVAAVADRYGSDLQTLIDAWPTNKE